MWMKYHVLIFDITQINSWSCGGLNWLSVTVAPYMDMTITTGFVSGQNLAVKSHFSADKTADTME